MDVEPINILSRLSNICGREIRLCGAICLGLRWRGGSRMRESQFLVLKPRTILISFFGRELSVGENIITTDRRGFAALTPHENSSRVSKCPFPE